MSRRDQFGETEEPTINGVAVAKVTDNEDPEGIGRVKVTYPFRDTDDESYWARVVTEMAGSGYGVFFLPEVGDEVLVAFEGGKIRHPVVVGSLYNGQRAPPQDNGDGENNVREIRSRSGHVLDFDDTDGEEKFEIETSAGHAITLDDTGGSEKITIEDQSGSNTIEMDSASGEVSVSGEQKISLSAPTIELSAESEVNVSAKETVNMEGKGEVNVSSKGQLNVESNGIMGIKATGPLTVEGAIIQLN
ncbi:phage tail protein [Halobacteriales archaeon QH_10_67_22]|nr:MAG: phage tail protein [Halobacteriales archaeon QH_10_67_22]